jgi:hypothetical protein
MADDQASTPAPSAGDAGETFSREYVDNLKAELARKSEAEAVLKAKFSAHESRQRAQLAELQPVVSEWIKEGMEAAPEHRHDMSPLQAFGDNLAKAENLDSAMPFARMISVHSARFKRERAEFSQVSATAEQLATANRELDEIRADRDAKVARVSELEALAEERLHAAEKMQSELARAGVLKEKLDFSKATSRETSPPESSGTPMKAPPRAPVASASCDPLLSFITASGSSGAARITPSATGHHLLGSSGEAPIESALRFL